MERITASRCIAKSTWRGFSLIAADKCTISLPENNVLHQAFGSHRTGKSDSVGPVAVEICCLFDALLRIPLYVEYATSNTSEFKIFKKFKNHLNASYLVLLDNGFYSLELLASIRKQCANFLIPLDAASRPTILQQLAKDDYLCRIRRQQTGETMEIRVIYAYRKGFRRRRLATSLLDPNKYPIDELCEIYHFRWNIETFYREFKSSMEGSRWHCAKVHSFELELHAKMILACLTRMAVQEAARETPFSVSDFSFSKSLHATIRFLNKLVMQTDSELVDAWNILLETIRTRCRLKRKQNRHFPRDKQEYRKKSRGLLKKRVGRPMAPLPPPPPEESRPQALEVGPISKKYFVLLS